MIHIQTQIDIIEHVIDVNKFSICMDIHQCRCVRACD